MATPIRKGIRSLIRTTGPADNPPAGQLAIYAKSDGFYQRDSSGVETKLANDPGNGALVDGGNFSTVHTGNLRVDFGSFT